MSNAYFAFRQFGIRQDRCAMKVSTDACIFGAWIPAPRKSGARILDIGAGTGLLSLMLAQRAPGALIEAVELDPAAAAQAAENCADSLFADRIVVREADARLYTTAPGVELIVSNPPFFANSLKGPDLARNAARHTDSLDIAELFALASRALTPDGALAVLLPREAESRLEVLAAAAGFFITRRLEIGERPGVPVKRGCWLLRRTAEMPVFERLDIRDGPDYSPSFRQLLRSYYLLF